MLCMGLGRSRARRMEGGNESGGESSADADRDLATMISYLIRSGQVRVLSSGGFADDDEDDDFVDDDDYVPRAEKPDEDPNPDTSRIDDSTLRQEILLKSGQSETTPVPNMIFKREVGQCRNNEGFSAAQCNQVSSVYLPNTMEKIETYRSKAFCGTFSQDGNIFISACQDAHIRIYNTRNGSFKLMKRIRAKNVGWSVVDTAFSPDCNYLIYSSWSDCVHLCNIYGDHETHEALNMCPEGDHSFCMFSLMFSADNSEILGGANDGCIYVYDREKHERILRIDSHEDDINAVAFADDSSHILFSGGDDGLVKVWDRRTLSETNPIEVGTLAGHTDGITFIDSRGDGRYLISNCKDQSIKLWDVRKFSGQSALEATKRAVARQSWDYRWQQAPRRARRFVEKVDGDTSLMTYRGHSVLHTLIRCRFSPEFTTGQRYIYSGCATGAVVIYDVLTGKVVDKLDGHRACVRDASWHPSEHRIISTSWDCSLGEWAYYPEEESFPGCCESQDSSDDDGFHARRFRSQRLRQKHKGRHSKKRSRKFRLFRP